MSTATDTFARFVDVLAETLDDHDASGAELASRLHLSRFHVDRLVSAAAGEPPATLRRRVLLERAAYRLITTDDDVLPVAVADELGCESLALPAFGTGVGGFPLDECALIMVAAARGYEPATLRRVVFAVFGAESGLAFRNAL